MSTWKRTIYCLLGVIFLSVFLWVGCQEKPAGREDPVPLPEDTDWTFEEKLPCGWFFYIQNGDESYPTDDLSGANAMFAYYKISYDQEYQNNAYELSINNFRSFDMTKNGISSDNGTEFASITLQVTFYHTAVLTPHNNGIDDPNNPSLHIAYVMMDPTTRELSLDESVDIELGRTAVESTFLRRGIEATRIRNGKKETAAVSVDFKVTAEGIDDLLQTTVIEYNDNAEEIKRTAVDKTKTNEYGNIDYTATENAAYVVVEREWRVPFDGGKFDLKAGDTYKTREVLERKNAFSIPSTTLWYPTESGLCDGKILFVSFSPAKE